MEHDIPAAEIPGAVKGVRLFNMDDSKLLAAFGTGMLTEGFAFKPGTDDFTGDLAAFPLQDGKPGALPLAPDSPAVGDKVWLVGEGLGEKGAEPTRYPATMLQVKPTIIALGMDVPVNFHGMSGCPAVDSQGRVVGILLSGGEPNGRTLIGLNPISGIRKRLRSLSFPAAKPALPAKQGRFACRPV